MPAFMQITLGKAHHKNVCCCRCGKKLKLWQKARRHQIIRETRYYCEECFKKLWY